MIRRLTSRLYHDEGLSWRALRSGMWTLAGFGGGQALRLVVNLALARLLFPSAFGTMARLCCTNRLRDSLFESNMVADRYEQLVPDAVQDQELAFVQHGAEAARFSCNLV